MKTASKDMIIKGVTIAGKTFRPGDWAERLSGAVATFGVDNRVSFSPHVQPQTRNGVRCVVVGAAYEQLAPQAYRFLMDFARDNDLVVESDATDLPHAA